MQGISTGEDLSILGSRSWHFSLDLTHHLRYRPNLSLLEGSWEEGDIATAIVAHQVSGMGSVRIGRNTTGG